LLLVLPLLCFALVFRSLWRARPEVDPRGAFLWAAVVWGVTTSAITELLSLFGWLNVAGLAVCWGTITLAIVLLTAGQAARPTNLPHARSTSMRGLDLAMGVTIAVVVLVTALIAVTRWPNSFDSMVYHLSRVLHWAQNASVAHYPTNILRQLYMPPWAEFAILHLTLLGGDPRLANLVQWFSMIGSVVGVSLIAACLGAGARGQLFSALLCATLPMGILQASSTQNDYVATFWLVCLAYALLRLHDTPSALFAAGVGASAGLAGLTKSTAPIFVAPLLVVLLFASKKHSWTVFIKQTVVVGLVGLAVMTPHSLRNLQLFRSPFSLTPASIDMSGTAALGASTLGVTNEALSIPILASNFIRNSAIHFATPLPKVNKQLERLVQRLHGGLAIELNHRATTLSENRFDVPLLEANELRAGNPLHLMLICGTLLYVGASRRLRQRPLLMSYVLAVFLAFLVFILVLKWQTQQTRLQLPLFVLWSPVVAFALQHHSRLIILSALGTALLALPFLLQNQAHPLLGRENLLSTTPIDQYFRFRPSMKAGYLGAAEVVRSTECSDVGLVLEWNDWEYPIWKLLETGSGQPRIEHVEVTNGSVRTERRRPSFRPCAVLVVRASTGQSLEVGGSLYSRAWSDDAPNRRAAVYLPASIVSQ
jgi:4-amino-4-deoxy-L-arabinose transferase-like glycosyltransferase